MPLRERELGIESCHTANIEECTVSLIPNLLIKYILPPNAWILQAADSNLRFPYLIPLNGKQDARVDIHFADLIKLSAHRISQRFTYH